MPTQLSWQPVELMSDIPNPPILGRIYFVKEVNAIIADFGEGMKSWGIEKSIICNGIPLVKRPNITFINTIQESHTYTAPIVDLPLLPTLMTYLGNVLIDNTPESHTYTAPIVDLPIPFVPATSITVELAPVEP